MKPRSERRILAARAARAALGASLALSFVALAVATGAERGASALLLLAWPLAAAVAGGAWLVGWTAAVVLPDLPLGAAGTSPVAAAGRPDELAPVRRLMDRLERASVIWPLVGASLLLPLTAHLLVTAPSALSGSEAFLRGLDGWIALSLAVVGHAHLLVAWRARRVGQALLRGEPTDVVLNALKTTGWAALLACVPGLLFLALPPLIVGVTGALVLPLAWSTIAGRYRKERALTPRT